VLTIHTKEKDQTKSANKLLHFKILIVFQC